MRKQIFIGNEIYILCDVTDFASIVNSLTQKGIKSSYGQETRSEYRLLLVQRRYSIKMYHFVEKAASWVT